VPVANVDIPAELKQWLESEAQRRGVSQRVVMILALEAYRKEREQMSDVSANMISTMGEGSNTSVLESNAR
jgi:hypothetical protein